MSDLLPSLAKLTLPRMFRVRQHFERRRLEDVAAAVRSEMAKPAIMAKLRPGLTAAVAAGSRGIANIPTLVATVVEQLKKAGLRVFIIPAMGSHGGATAEGQLNVLHHLGITEQSAAAPIRSSMEAVQIGSTVSVHGNVVPLYMDATAHREADLIVPVVRVKPHTGFKGTIESGIGKMLTIGLGKHVGCDLLHREGMHVFDHLIPAAAEVVLATGKIGFAVAVVENAYEETAVVEAVPAEAATRREPELLILAKQLMAKLLLPRIDVLVIEQFGKNISGVGMDSNVTGRSELGGPMKGFDGPAIDRIVVLSLTEQTYGNAHGIGHADIITEKVFQQLDRKVTWTNTLTAGSLACGKLPIALPTEEQTILAAASCVFGVPAERTVIVRIKNTLCLTDIAVSESGLDMVKAIPACEVLGPWDGRWLE